MDPDSIVFDFDAPFRRSQEGINDQGFPVSGYNWDADKNYNSWNGLTFFKHKGTLDDYKSNLENTDVMKMPNAYFRWGRDRGPADLWTHNLWYINPLLPEETQRYILQYEIDRCIHNKRCWTELTQEGLVELIAQFQTRMEDIAVIREKHIALVRG